MGPVLIIKGRGWRIERNLLTCFRNAPKISSKLNLTYKPREELSGMPRADHQTARILLLKNFNLLHLNDKMSELNYSPDLLQQQFAKLI